MSAGIQAIVYNPSERAISDDQNRAQLFRSLDVNEVLRALGDTNFGFDDVQASSLNALTVVQKSPVSGVVLAGLVVRPAIGSLNLTVDPGIAGLYDPDASPNPDESQYKVVRDLGVPLSQPTLAMTANSSGSLRLDVIECARVAGGFVVLETDNRDIFNTATGLFTATNVNKVVVGALQYRVRAGTPGGGFPGTAAGWMPLAVASVPTGTTTNDTVTFWDVRPLMADRVLPPFNLSVEQPRGRPSAFQIDNGTNSAQSICRGYCESTATDLTLVSQGIGGNYRLGGQFGLGTITPIDLNLAQFRAGTLTSSAVAYVYLTEPYGLPRWAQYTTVASGARAPANPRGVVLLANVVPVQLFGCPSSPLTLPAILGGGSTTKGVCIAVTATSSGICLSVLTDGQTQKVGFLPTIFASANGTIASTVINFTIAATTNYPSNARAVEALITVPYSVAAALVDDSPSITVQLNSSGGIFWASELAQTVLYNPGAGTVTGPITYRVKIPIPPGATSAFVQMNPGGNIGSSLAGTPTITVVGWDLY